MARVVNHRLVDQDAFQRLREPRADWLVAETATGSEPDATFTFSDGPFTSWQRAVVAEPPDRLAPKNGPIAVTETIDSIPGVSSQQQTFNQILGITVVIALVVIALFFALLTVERAALYGVLKAIGARSGTLFGGLVLQAVAVTLVASLVAGIAVVALDFLIPPGSIPLSISALRIATSVALLLLASILGCAFSLRRVLRVDPASALGG